MHNSLLSLWLTAKIYRFSAGAVFFGEADFFFAKRLFSSGGGDVSGERQLPTVAESEDK